MIRENTFEELFGYEFGESHRGSQITVPGIFAHGIKFHLEVNGHTVFDRIVDAMGGGFYICTVDEALDQPSNRGQAAQDKIEALHRHGDDLICFPKHNILRTNISRRVINQGDEARLTITDDHGNVQHIHFVIECPGNLFSFNRSDAGSNMRLHHSFT